MRRILIAMYVLSLITILHTENYLLNGGQDSRIKYKLIQQIEPTSETVTVDLSFVVPQSFDSPTYKQRITNFTMQFSIDPDKSEEWTDERGNQIRQFSWENPVQPFRVEVAFSATNTVVLKPIDTQAPYPIINLSAEERIYLKGSELVQIDNLELQRLAERLVRDSQTQFDAVQKILSWIIDHMTYVLTPEQYDAVYSLQTGSGNCQNYSHLSAALMRHVGIPVRIVNGITLKQPYNIDINDRLLTMNMAEGRHSWIEVYFPDLGWMPFDPQQSQLFVSNRFIRVEVGRDNKETMNDGLVRWTRKKGSKLMLSFQEFIEADFVNDQISIIAKRENTGPRKLLLTPEVEAVFLPVEPIVEEEPLIFDEASILNLKFETPFIFGNLKFPEGLNFAFNRIQKEKEAGVQELQKNFLVETAEYITGKFEYSQTFELDKPILLSTIGLALQKFGGSGSIYLELREDVEGNPGPVAARSARINLKSISSRPGYYWVDFDFKNQQLVLTPDRYWIKLAYSGTPIINWFYSYGKPVGPLDGTRYKLKQENSWDKSLGYEFNYRVTGLSPK